jgi:hypothetical protein
VDERPSSERDVLRVPVGPVLRDRVLDVLGGEVVLQLGGCDRDAGEEVPDSQSEFEAVIAADEGAPS